MSNATLVALRDWFGDYSASFIEGGSLPAMQQLKFDHCFRVADNAREIAGGLGWAEDDQIIAEAAGLLHDVGRFRQYAQYRTFVDRLSVNHAECSCQVLEEEKVLSGWSDSWREAVMAAVRYHNCRDLPEDLPERSLMQLRLIRDADKLDIYEVMDDALRYDRLSLYPELVLNVNVEGPPSPAVMDGLESGASIGYEMIQSLADFLLIQLNWVYTINYDPALRMMLERNVIGRIRDHLPGTDRVRALLQTAEDELERRL